MSSIRFGLVGYGRFGSLHAQAIASTDDAELVAIAEHSAEARAAAQSAHPKVDVCTDYRELTGRNDIDVVDVAVPTFLHFEVGKAALESGKHLFIEKPMADSLEHCRELNALAEAKGKRLAVGFKRRVSRLWKKVKQMIADGAIGQPLYAVFELWRWPYRQGAEGWRYDVKRVGSWILEEPVHCFDKARWYFAGCGEPVSIYAAANSSRPGQPELQDNFSAVVTFPHGGHAVITQTLGGFGHHHGARLTGTEGALWARWGGATDSDRRPTATLQYLHGDDVRQVPLPDPGDELHELRQEMAVMVRAVRDGGPVVATGLDGAWSVALCEAAQQSIDTGEVVSLGTVPFRTPQNAT